MLTVRLLVSWLTILDAVSDRNLLSWARYTMVIALVGVTLESANAQSWSGILAPARGFDWSNAGLPATFPDGETTANPWTPPTTRTQCATSACNTVLGGSVTATTVNAAASSAPSGTFVPIPAGTFNLGGNVSITTSNVTLRGTGADTTKLTGGDISVGGGSWGGATLLTANPAKGATSFLVAAPPSAGRIAALEQCDDNMTAANANYTHFGSGVNCSGTYADPSGPWVCGLNSACDRNGGGSVFHYQTHVFWIQSVVGSTVTVTSPLANGNWSTARTAALLWFNTTGTVGIGLEDFTLQGHVGFTGTYACWLNGMRLITTSGTNPDVQVFKNHFDSHSLVVSSYAGSTVGGTGASLFLLGSDSGEQGESDFLLLNNAFDGGWFEGIGDQVNIVFAYNYVYTAANTSFVENGEFQHHAGTSFLLREGNLMGYSLDDDTWGTHNFNTWFRNQITCKDFAFPSTGNAGFQLGSFARFENVLANGIGGGPGCTTYNNTFQTNTLGVDPMVVPTLFNWGNYVLCSGDARCNNSSFLTSGVPTDLSAFGANSIPFQNAVPVDHNLPASFFMNTMTPHPNGGTGLGWWKACDTWAAFPTNCIHTTTPPIPIMGPEVTGGPNFSGHGYNPPAAVAFAALPVDSNYSTTWGGLRRFDRRAFTADSGSPVNPPAPASGLFATISQQMIDNLFPTTGE